jgi:cell division transport system ATP-binding protein
MIHFHNVSCSYQKHNTLTNITFSIAKGEFVYVIGASGAGKSTLLKLIYRDVVPDSGNLKVAEFDAGNLKKRQLYRLRRKVGIVFQDFKLLDDRSVFDNIAFVLKVTNTKNRQIKKRVSKVLKEVGLVEKSDKRPSELSGGEQQRVAIARAIVNEPYILIADEPTGNLDPTVSREIIELLQKINRRGTAILMATHDYNLIQAFPNRTLRVEQGEVSEL